MASHLIGIDHVALAMPPGGEQAARYFYRDLLGLAEVEKPPVLAARGGCWFWNGAVMVHLGVEEDFAPARKAHPCFVASDLAHLQSRLVHAGVPVTPDSAVEGVRRFYADDPFGNRIEFIQSGEGFSQR